VSTAPSAAEPLLPVLIVLHQETSSRAGSVMRCGRLGTAWIPRRGWRPVRKRWAAYAGAVPKRPQRITDPARRRGFLVQDDQHRQQRLRRRSAVDTRPGKRSRVLGLFCSTETASDFSWLAAVKPESYLSDR